MESHQTQVLTGELMTSSVDVLVQLGRREWIDMRVATMDARSSDMGVTDFGGRCSDSRWAECRSNGFLVHDSGPRPQKLE